MKIRYFIAALGAVGVAAVGAGTHLTDSGSDYCPNPSAASVTALFAPCQTFDDAMGRSVSRKEAVQMGLLTPDLQPKTASQFASSRKPDLVVR
jgi:hypothetical protein